MKTICHNNKKYNISDDVWDKYKQIHQGKSEKALVFCLNTLAIEKPFFDENDIETLIINESNLVSSLPSIIKKARKAWDNLER